MRFSEAASATAPSAEANPRAKENAGWDIFLRSASEGGRLQPSTGRREAVSQQTLVKTEAASLQVARGRGTSPTWSPLCQPCVRLALAKTLVFPEPKFLIGRMAEIFAALTHLL